jgi:hypothetical protein
MGERVEVDREAFASRFRASLEWAEGEVARLGKLHARLQLAGVASSGAATVVMAITAAQVPITGRGAAAWRLLCIVAAVLAFAATLLVALSRQLRLGERLSTNNEVLGRLKVVDLALEAGSRPWEEVVKEYEEIVRTYPRVAE